MKNLKHQIGKHLSCLGIAAAMLFGITSCDMMTDDYSECTLRVAFKYDMNMKFADAFEHEVSSVTLYAYDKSGKLAYTKTESVKSIIDRGGYMEVDDITPGEYTLKVWAEGEERYADSWIYGASGTSKENTSDKGSLTDNTCKMNRSEREVKHELTSLYYGEVTNADLTHKSSDNSKNTVTVPLIKDTNYIRVVLQNASGEKINADDFTFKIEDDNTSMSYDNSLIPGDSVTYYAWSKYDGAVGDETEGGAQTSMSAVVAEFTVGRLTTGTSPQLKVYDKEGTLRFSVPVTDYALLVKGEYNKKMDDQEYLDRCDEYNFIFFIDDSSNWIRAQILVHSWRVVINNTHLGS